MRTPIIDCWLVVGPGLGSELLSPTLEESEGFEIVSLELALTTTGEGRDLRTFVKYKVFN